MLDAVILQVALSISRAETGRFRYLCNMCYTYYVLSIRNEAVMHSHPSDTYAVTVIVT